MWSRCKQISCIRQCRGEAKLDKNSYRAYSDQNSGVPTPPSGPKSEENDSHRMTCRRWAV